MIRTIPDLDATENVPCSEKTLYAHYFSRATTGFVAELDPETGRAFVYSLDWRRE